MGRIRCKHPYRMLAQRYQPRTMPFETAGNLELQQHAAYGCCGRVRVSHQIVNRYRRRAINANRRVRSPSGGMSDGSSGGCAASSAEATLMLLPRIGSVIAMTSAASVTGVAPCLRSPLVPSLRGSSGEPGTAKTSRPCSPANRAVISDPERRAASTTTTRSSSLKCTGSPQVLPPSRTVRAGLQPIVAEYNLKFSPGWPRPLRRFFLRCR